VSAHRGQDARVCPFEQSHPSVEKKKYKATQAEIQDTNYSDVLQRTGSEPTYLSHSYPPLPPTVWNDSYKQHLESSLVRKGLLTHLTPGTGHSRKETELHRIAVSNTMWARKWNRLESISCIKHRVLLRPACDLLIPNTSDWLVIQNPPLEIWVTEEVIPYQGECKNQITAFSNSPQQFRPPHWCLPIPAWGLTVVRWNLLFKMDPCSSTAKWSQEYAERISHSFSRGDSLWSQKFVVVGQASWGPTGPGGEAWCCHISGIGIMHFSSWTRISYTWYLNLKFLMQGRKNI
jgi:hypothetical protein